LGYGASVGLEQVLARRFHEQLAKQQARQQADQAAESRRRFDLTYERQVEADKALAAMREAEAAKDRAAAEKDAQRRAGLQSMIDDPATPAGLRQLLQLQTLGVNNVGIHDLEPADAHAAHVQAGQDAEFGDWKRRQDYQEHLIRARPERPNARLRMDDPSFPAGVQSHVATIRAQHPTFESALAEFVNSIDAHRQAHPNFQPQKAIDALRAGYSGGGRPAAGADGDLDGLVQGAVAEAMRGGGGGRAGDPGVQSPGGSVPEADGALQARAREAIRRQLGRDPTDAEVAKVLSSPENRRKLGGS
jgi:hypothetical protein